MVSRSVRDRSSDKGGEGERMKVKIVEKMDNTSVKFESIMQNTVSMTDNRKRKSVFR